MQNISVVEPKKIGRPLSRTPEQVSAIIEKYFEETPIDRWMVTELEWRVFPAEDDWQEYEERPAFRAILKEAKKRIKRAYEARLVTRGNAGDIFAAKNILGWIDERSHKVQVQSIDDVVAKLSARPAEIDIIEGQLAEEDELLAAAEAGEVVELPAAILPHETKKSA